MSACLGPFRTFPSTLPAACTSLGFHSDRLLQRDAVVGHVGNPKLEQESIEGTHAQETPAYQRRPTTLYEVQGSNPPIRALYMQLA